MEKEIWKTVIIDGVEYPMYMVSNLGRVKSLNYKRTGKEKPLTPHKNTDGYLEVRIKNKSQRVHRLVAEAFIPNPNNLPEVDHINGDRTDARAVNLRYVTHKENTNNPITRKRQSERMTNNNPFKGKRHPQCMIEENRRKQIEDNLQGKTVYQFDKNGEYIGKFKSCKEVERKLGYDASSVAKCCNGKQKTVHGFVFSYHKNIKVKVEYKHIKKVYQYTLDKKFIKEFENAKVAADTLGLERSNISATCLGKHKSCGGYWFSFHRILHTRPLF